MHVYRARSIAMTSHLGQVDKSGYPYFEHVDAVARITNDLISLYGSKMTFGDIDIALMAAYLHDVVEDTPTTLADLAKEGFPDPVLDIVKMLTRDRSTGQTYMQWVRSIARSGNRAAIIVKLADNMHNADPARIAALPEHERSIADRYRRSMDILRAALADYSSRPL